MSHSLGIFVFFHETGLFLLWGFCQHKCFFVIRSSQISTLPQQICNWTKPGPRGPIAGQSSQPKWQWHSCGVSVTVHVYKSVRRGEVEIETGDKVPFLLLSTCHLALNSSDRVCACSLTVREWVMKCHSLSVVCHSLWWSSKREAATRAHLSPDLLSGFSFIPSTFYLSHTRQRFSSFYSVHVLISFSLWKKEEKGVFNFFSMLFFIWSDSHYHQSLSRSPFLLSFTFSMPISSIPWIWILAIFA